MLDKLLPIPKHSLTYNIQLDSLRGIAVLLVLFFHIYPVIFSFGYVGVDIFFVLSGYLITGIIISKIEAGKFSFLEFYRNRIRRIFPAMLIVLSATLIMGYIFLFPGELTNLAKHIKASSLFFQNINLSSEVGYWDTESAKKPLLHFWSLSIEEQFYLFWPLLLLFIAKIKRSWELKLFILVMILFAISLFKLQDSFYGSFSRFWELALGGFAYSIKEREVFKKINQNIFLIIFTLTIALAWGNNEFSHTKTLAIVLSSALLIISFNHTDSKIFNSKILLFFGLISYPLYLWHYAVISYLHIFGFDVGSFGVWIVIGSTLLAYLTFRFMESYSRGVESYRFAIVLFVVVVTLYFVGNYIEMHDGLRNRQSINIGKNATYLKELNGNNEAISTDNGKVLLKKLLGHDSHIHHIKSTSSKNDREYIVMIGDSHALRSYDGFAKEIIKDGRHQFLSLSNNSTVPFFGAILTTSAKKAKKREQSIADIYRVIEKLKPKKVIFVSRETVYLTKRNFGTRIAEMENLKFYDKSNLNYKDRYFKAYDDTFRYFKERKISLFLIHENPELGFSPQECLMRPFDIGKTKNICGIELKKYNQRTIEYKARIKTIAKKYDNVQILDTKDIFCDSKFCYGIKDDKMLYSDDNHLTMQGSVLQAEKLIPIILKEQAE